MTLISVLILTLPFLSFLINQNNETDCVSNCHETTCNVTMTVDWIPETICYKMYENGMESTQHVLLKKRICTIVPENGTVQSIGCAEAAAFVGSDPDCLTTFANASVPCFVNGTTISSTRCECNPISTRFKMTMLFIILVVVNFIAASQFAQREI